MKNPFEVLKSKEQEVVKVRKEVDALRVAIRLIGDENPALRPSRRWICARLSKCRRQKFRVVHLQVKHKHLGDGLLADGQGVPRSYPQFKILV